MPPRETFAAMDDSTLYAYALTHGFSLKAATTKSGPCLTYSYCYGVGYSDTQYWLIPYKLDSHGLPTFERRCRESLMHLLCEQHLETWRALCDARASLRAAEEAHLAYLKSQP